MYHWDLPQPLQVLGGWTNPVLANYFEDYARVLYTNIGDKAIFLFSVWGSPCVVNQFFAFLTGYAAFICTLLLMFSDSLSVQFSL